jgi:hypothetical protein
MTEQGPGRTWLSRLISVVLTLAVVGGALVFASG